MLTYFDIIQDEEFRDFARSRIAIGANNPSYFFSSGIPKLYKYQTLSHYAIDNVISGFLSASRIGEFNDLFDGAMHCYGSEEERRKAAEIKWSELKALTTAASLSKDLIEHDYYVNLYADHFKTDSRLKFRQLDYLGTYAICLSTKNNSTLMWSHYADSNTGMCVEYDYNGSQVNQLQRQMLFPVAYSSEPIDVLDLLEDEKSKICKYPLETAVLCTALNKSIDWEYENEWRLVLVIPSLREQSRRLPIIAPKPTRIILGYHFLKPFFYHDHKDAVGREEAKRRLKDFRRLLDFVKSNEIPISVMIPVVGGYELKPTDIPVEELFALLNYHFEDDDPEDIRYYYVVHDEMMDILT